jgi:hypothetical protein
MTKMGKIEAAGAADQTDLFAYVAMLKADARGMQSVRQTVSDVIARADTVSVVFVDMMSDIILLSDRLRRDAPDMRRAFGYSDDIRLTAAGLADLCYSAAATAGFTAFLRADDRWTLQICSEHDPRGILVTSELHRLRAELARNMSGIMRLVRGARTDDALRKALANLCIALSAAHSPGDKRELQCLAHISLTSGDPQGDAMVAVQDHENRAYDEPLQLAARPAASI